MVDKTNYLISWFLLSILLAASWVSPAWCQGRQVPVLPLPAPVSNPVASPPHEKTSNSWLVIAIHPREGKLKPPGELMLSDPRGRKIGNDPLLKKVYQEIPQASYEFEGIDDDITGEPGPQSGTIYILNQLDGPYTLRVFGLETGMYLLEIRESVSDSKFISRSQTILQGDVHCYLISYSSKGAGIEVTPTQPAPQNRP